jgi:membrane-associated phospholipid phosphatase
MTDWMAGLRPWRQGSDWIGIVYALTSGLYPLLNPACFDVVHEPGPLHGPLPHLAWHLVLAAVIWTVPPLLRMQGRWPLRLLGVIALPLMFPLFYAELEFLGVVFRDFGDSFDPWLIALEQRWFGMQPSLEWSRAMPWRWLYELMEFAYFSYYFFGLFALVLIWRTGRRDAARNWALTAAFVRDLVAVMLTCYAWYTFFPVWGPKYFDYQGLAGPIPGEGLRGFVFHDIMVWIHANGALSGAAFPSSHVAGSMVSWWWGWKIAPRHRVWLTVLWGLLCLSIVYCRYHYVIDLVAGVAWGALVVALTSRLMAMPADGLRQPSLASAQPLAVGRRTAA